MSARTTTAIAGDAKRAIQPRIDPKAISNWLLTRFSRVTTTGRLIPQIDGLRFAAIGLVILFHLNGYLVAKWPIAGSLGQSSWLAQSALVGFRGVELFFVISGFILALPFAGHHLVGGSAVNLRSYYLRRLTRLEPPYVVTLILLFLLTVVVQGKSAARLLPHLLAGLTYSHSLIYGAPNGIAWSLEIEVQFYLLVPLLTLLFAIRQGWARRAVFVILILASETAQVLWISGSARASLSILAYLQFFLIGFLLADIFLVNWQESPQPRLAWDVAALAGWPLLLTLLRFDWFAAWLFPFAILLLYCAAFKGTIGRRVFSNRWIVMIGGMCYSIYLIHYEVISAVGRVTKPVGAGHSYWLYLPVQLALVGVPIVAVCGVYFAVLEKPCMRRDWPQRLRERAQQILTALLTGPVVATSRGAMAAVALPNEPPSGD
ncbi:MAG TPA: acyltransferase [Terriglobales bacterium]